MTFFYARQHQRGFSLVELLMTISIVAVLAAVAIPSFDSMIKNARRRQSVENFWHAIFLARSEAIKRNSLVVLCKSQNGIQCDNSYGSWANGWLVFENLDHDDPAQIDAGEPILRIYNADKHVSVTSNVGRQTFAFRPYAQSGITGTIVFCDTRGSSEARAIIISQTGRPRQSQRDASNRPLNCPSV